jgi:hypothetical protein
MGIFSTTSFSLVSILFETIHLMGVGEKYYKDYFCYRIFHGTADRSGNHIETQGIL